MIPNWSETAYQRLIKSQKEETESPLQSKITQWAKAKGYPYHAHPSTREYLKAHGHAGSGWPDIVLCLPKGRTVYLELKAKKGVLKEKQKEIHLQMSYLGHEYYQIRSFKKFKEIVNEEGG